MTGSLPARGGPVPPFTAEHPALTQINASRQERQVSGSLLELHIEIARQFAHLSIISSCQLKSPRLLLWRLTATFQACGERLRFSQKRDQCSAPLHAAWTVLLEALFLSACLCSLNPGLCWHSQS